jgi:hypothetical protein
MKFIKMEDVSLKFTGSMQRSGKMNKVPFTIIYSIILTLNLALFIIVFFFFNQVLFILHGYDVNLIDSSSVDSFSAFKEIYSSKLPVLLSLLTFSTTSFWWTIRLRNRMSKWLYAFLFLSVGIIAILSVAVVFLYFVIPSRVL